MPGAVHGRAQQHALFPQLAAGVVALGADVHVAVFQFGQFPGGELAQGLAVLGVVPADIGHGQEFGVRRVRMSASSTSK
jgi:hypothetical protein